MHCCILSLPLLKNQSVSKYKGLEMKLNAPLREALLLSEYEDNV